MVQSLLGRRRACTDLGAVATKKDLQALEAEAQGVADLAAYLDTKRQALQWSTIWKGLVFIDETSSRPTWPRRPAGLRVGNAWSIMHRSEIGARRPLSALCRHDRFEAPWVMRR